MIVGTSTLIQKYGIISYAVLLTISILENKMVKLKEV